uniref:Rap-GAP domain-containing protein n=1 Tax=Mesocestoides corti TaxID=53468 RepID=A0A5K3F716_MESCO
MLMRVWMRALSLHYPSPGYWQGLAELCLIARHRVGLGYVWSRVVVIFTYNLLRPHIADCLLRPVKQAPREGSLHRLNLPQFTAYQPLINRHLMVDLPRDVANASWFRFLHLFGNPTDLCHPSLITHTATFEYFRRLNGVARCRLTASFLPAIFHQALRSISTIVDLFIGIAPSLSGCLFTFVGIPPNLYGPIDITEYFKYTSVRAPDTIFVDKQNAGCEALGASSAASEPPESAPPPASAVNSSGSMVRTVGHSSALVNPQTLVEEWLRPDAFVTAFYNRPEAASLLQLLGPWLFEAAVNGTSLAKATDNAAASVKEGAVSRERASTVDNFSFHVGRAEAVACLCRIFIYARRTQIALILLARFYACLVRALTVEPEVEYVLSTVLLHAPDLLRANLEASSVLVPTIFNACQWVLRKNSVVCPDYVSMVLLRRACLHQLLSMVCLPSQFDGIQFRDISSPTTSDAGALSARALRTKLAGLLCDLLTYETDTHNLRMILSGGFALVLDMISVESSPSKGTYQKSLSSTADAASSLETASGLYGALLDKISMSWRRWMNDFPLSLFALDVLIGLANAPVPKPSIAHCRRCIQSICAFIESQCKREKKDHTRALHSLIINAFQCLSVWLVAHPPALMEYETLRAVVETIKLGIFGAEATSTSASQTSESRSSLPLPSAMPFSKRVSEAAEHLLSTLFSSVGTFPQASGPETLSSHLTEDHLAKVSCASNFRHFLTPSDLVLSVSESVPSSGNESDHQDGCRRVADPSPVLTFLRDDSGRHLWSWKLRYEPKKVARGSNETSAQTTLRSKTIRPLRSCLENIVSTKRPVGSESLFLPKTREKIPLVKSEKVMPTLAQVVVGSSARKEVDALKSLIASEAQKCEELGQRVRETRLKACRGVTCRPERMMKNFPSGHILASNLGYIPVNNLSASSSSFRATNSSSQLQQQQQQQTIDVPLSNSKPRRPSARIPGTKGVGSNVEISSIIPSSLIPLPPSMATKIDSSLFTNPRSTSTLFVFYVTEGQTSLNDVIANMNSWSSTPKVFQSFMCSLGWVVDCTRHPGWKGSVKRSRGNLNAPHPAESGYHGSTPSGASVDWRRNPPDGIDSLFYWADASTEVVSLCPSWRTKVAEKSTDDFRAGVLWLEAWDDALWMPPSGEPNPLQAALASQFGCGLVILIHPLTNNGLFRIGLIQQHHIEHQVGPLTTGLVLSAALLGSMVRSTVVNAAHRLAADSGDLSNGLSRKVLATIENKQFASAVELLLWSSERCY